MDLRRYIYSHCVSPVRMNVWDSYSQTYVTRELPCGQCIHCNNTHVNEWCTRLFAQRKYSKYCYYVSLDYAPFDLTNSVSYQLAKETAACYHNINKNHRYGMHPLVLCKNHLQDFYKRLRKNTGLKLQYFACGEYGTHADGKGYARPHFHNIIFCDSPIGINDFLNAWSIDGYTIGRVDFVDMNDIALQDPNESLKIFKYVCKYLQKNDFNFERLATIDFHRAYFESINYVVEKHEDLFKVSFLDKSLQLSAGQKDELWKAYIREFSPFVVCSRRPSIGSAYLSENLERFQKQDFRLFGLSIKGLAFPRYYIRKTKESLIPYQCIGKDSKKPSSESRFGTIIQILSKMYDTRVSLENWCESSSASTWHLYYENKGGVKQRCIKHDSWSDSIRITDLNFYDAKNKFMYQFDGYAYNVWSKLSNGCYALLDKMDIIDVIHEISPCWDRFHDTWLKPLHIAKVGTEKDLYDLVTKLYPDSLEKTSFDMFRDEIAARYKVELDNRYIKRLKMSNSKQTL